MKLTESAGGLVLDPAGRVLVVSQNGDSWSLPKGHIDPGEDALAAARREIYEESGVSQLELVRPLGRYERPRIAKGGGDDTREIKGITMFLFRTRQTELKPVDPKHPEACWLDRKEAAARLTHPKDKEFFLKAVTQID